MRALRGRTHELNSALALVRDGAVLFDCVDSARLTMRDISDRFLDDYLDMAGDAALASVGAYQLEGIGVHLFERVDGDYFTILGLPLLPLLAYLRQNEFIDGYADPEVGTGFRKIMPRITIMFILGLTGSLAMGKSATAKMFVEEGVPLHDADAVVHRLYDGEATAAIEAAFPGTTAGGKVDRDKLGKRVLGDAAAIKRLEEIVHPLVAAASAKFLAEAEAQRRSRSRCSTCRCCSRPAATSAATRWWWCRRRPNCSASARSSGPA